MEEGQEDEDPDYQPYIPDTLKQLTEQLNALPEAPKNRQKAKDVQITDSNNNIGCSFTANQGRMK